MIYVIERINQGVNPKQFGVLILFYKEKRIFGEDREVVR